MVLDLAETEGWPGWSGLLLGARRGISLGRKGTGVGCGGTGRSGNSRNSGGPDPAPFAPQAVPRGWLVGVGGEWSAVAVEAAAGWELPFLTLSGVQGGPHCITLGASAPGFAASWAPGGGTLPVFQQTINHFTLPALSIAGPDLQRRPSHLSVLIPQASPLLGGGQELCLQGLLRVGASTLLFASLASSPGKELTLLFPALNICPILQQ